MNSPHYMKASNKAGFLYAMTNGAGLYKVGFSANVAQRLVSMASQKRPDQSELQLIGVRPAVMRDEWALHLSLIDYRVPGFGEWYYGTPEVVKAVHSLNLRPIAPESQPERTPAPRSLRTIILSPRELQTAQSLIAGSRCSIIARDLGLSSKTVDTYRASIFRKLNINSIAELVHLSIKTPALFA